MGGLGRIGRAYGIKQTLVLFGFFLAKNVFVYISITYLLKTFCRIDRKINHCLFMLGQKKRTEYSRFKGKNHIKRFNINSLKAD